jgi:hypothetical protein
MTGYADGGDQPDKTIEVVPEALVAAEVYLADKPEIRARFDRVASLVEGFESSFGLELLSSVYWVATREGASNVKEATALVHAWNERKKRFLPEQIAIAWDTLIANGWIREKAA